MSFPLSTGRSYTIVGACDDDCKNIDLDVVNSQGLVVASDYASADFPVVRLSVPASGDYTVRIILQDCSFAPCYVGARLLAPR
jgi:hypothetical protein